MIESGMKSSVWDPSIVWIFQAFDKAFKLNRICIYVGKLFYNVV